MKRIVCYIALAALLTVCCAGCDTASFLEIPGNYIAMEEHFDPNAFQDSVDYCKIYYSDDEWFASSISFRRIDEEDFEELRGYFSDFSNWMEVCGREDEYDFSPECITAGDYVRLRTKEGMPIGSSVYGKYDNYSVWFFDADTCILYYIHANI